MKRSKQRNKGPGKGEFPYRPKDCGNRPEIEPKRALTRVKGGAARCGGNKTTKGEKFCGHHEWCEIGTGRRANTWSSRVKGGGLTTGRRGLSKRCPQYKLTKSQKKQKKGVPWRGGKIQSKKLLGPVRARTGVRS